MVIAYLLYTVIGGLLGELGRSDDFFARRAAIALQVQAKDSFSSVVIDNTKWDEAVEHTHGTPDEAWFEETWGAYTTGENYDGAVLLDNSGSTLIAFRDGLPSALPAEAITGIKAGDLRNALGHMSGKYAVDVRVARTQDGFVISAIAPIVMSDGSFQGTELTRFMAFTRNLTPGFLGTKGSQLGLQRLTISQRPVAGKSSVPVVEVGAGVVGYWSWDTRTNTAAISAGYRQIVWAILGSLIFVISVLLNMSWKGFREAHIIKAQALASALRDDLTGLPNRRQVLDTLGGLLAKPFSEKEGLSVVFADLDGFKEVNDAYGHEVGDQLLKIAAGGFEFLAKDRGVVSRLGGDEFCIVITGLEAARNARDVAQNMRRFLAEPIVIGGRVASVSVSAGIVDRTADDTAIDAEEFLRRADTAMYSAKSGGRNTVHVYEPSLDQKREESRRIARELRIHLDAIALGVVYQPIVDARSRSIVGVEALVRWPQGVGRNVTPDVFIPVAEEFGMIEEIGYFVMLEACRQAMQWPHLFMSVNVSPLQFLNPAFTDTVEKILRNTGMEPQRLEIEVTEGLIIDNTDRVANILERLHNTGITVALDDFGSGFSSIGQLRRFHFDKLKLDRSMVTDILRQPSALRLVQGTIAMADALGLKVTAEGIEDENQVSVLRLAGCSQFQGFLFSRPQDARAISAMLQSSPAAMAS